MTLWHIIRFTTIRHHWRRVSKWGNVSRGAKTKKAVAWDPNELHRFLNGDKMESNQMVHQDHKGQG